MKKRNQVTIQEALITSARINTRTITLRQTLVKFMKTKDKEKILCQRGKKAVRGEKIKTDR